jgi:hypothetical protein
VPRRPTLNKSSGKTELHFSTFQCILGYTWHESNVRVDLVTCPHSGTAEVNVHSSKRSIKSSTNEAAMQLNARSAWWVVHIIHLRFTPPHGQSSNFVLGGLCASVRVIDDLLFKDYTPTSLVSFFQ